MEMPYGSLPARVYAVYNCRKPNKTQTRPIACLHFIAVNMAEVDNLWKTKYIVKRYNTV